MRREQIRQYGIAIVTGLEIFVFLSVYLILRRGYFDLYIINKVLAGTSLLLLGIVLLIGALSRLYQRFDGWVIYRKELGIMSFFAAAAHGTISLFFLPQKFPVLYFQKNILTFILGFSATVILTYLFIISFEKVIGKMDKKKWWEYQIWGARIAGVLIFLHLFVLKLPGWIKWYTVGGSAELTRPYFPPASIIAGLFGLLVLLIRLIELINKSLAKIMTPVLSITMVVFVLFSFYWGKMKTPNALPLKWETCIKLPGSIIQQTYPGLCVSTDGRSIQEQNKNK